MDEQEVTEWAAGCQWLQLRDGYPTASGRQAPRECRLERRTAALTVELSIVSTTDLPVEAAVVLAGGLLRRV